MSQLSISGVGIDTIHIDPAGDVQEVFVGSELVYTAAIPLYSDNFNRADGPLGSNWTPGAGGTTATGLAISTGHVTGNGSALWNGALGSTDHYCEIQGVALTGAGVAYMGVRGLSTGRPMVAGYVSGSGAWEIVTIAANGQPIPQASAGAGTLKVSPNDTFRFLAQGNTYTLAQNGSEIVTWTDGTNAFPYTTANVYVSIAGVSSVFGTAALDNFAASDVS